MADRSTWRNTCPNVTLSATNLTWVDIYMYVYPAVLNPDGARFYAPAHNGPAHPASCKMGTSLLPGVKRLGRGVSHPSPSSAEVKGSVQSYLYSPSVPSWQVIGWLLPLPWALLLPFTVQYTHLAWVINTIQFNPYRTNVENRVSP